MAKTKEAPAGGAFRLRVSDVLEVPLRGMLVRFRVLDGRPSIGDLKPGRQLRMAGPDGTERTVTIVDHAVTGGRQTQERLDTLRELDVIVSADEGRPIGLGWTASGPVRE